MDTRIGRSEFARQRLTTSAPAQDRRPPPPPAVPSPRRGRSSDERAETQSADRNRTRSPIARNRPAQTTIRTSGSAFLGDRPNEPRAGSSTDVPHPANPPPRRAMPRDPASYISDDDWAAMRSGQAFGSAPETGATVPSSSPRDDTESIASASTGVPDLTRPARAWAEPNRRRANDPLTFGHFFNVHGVSEREAQARQVTQDFFEQLQTAGLLYEGFRLGYDQQGRVIDPNLMRRTEWNRVDQYQWAVFTGIQEPLVRPNSVVNLIPTFDNPSGTGMFDQSHVQWFLSGWKHEVYNHRTGRRDRYY